MDDKGHINEQLLPKLMDEVLVLKNDNPERVAKLCEEIIQKSEGDYMYGQAFGEYYYAEACYRMNRPNELMEHAITGLGIQKAYAFHELETKSYNLLGAYFVTSGDFQTGLSYYLEGIELARTYEINTMIKVFYNNFGDLYLQLKDYEKAIYYFNRTRNYLDHSMSHKMTDIEIERTCIRHSNLITAYLALGNIPKALDTANDLMVHVNENFLKNNSPMFYCILTRLNYAKGKEDQAKSSAKMFTKTMKERMDLAVLNDAYFPMCEFFITHNWLDEAEELLKFMLILEHDYMNPYHSIELRRMIVEFYKKKDEPERLFDAYRMYYEVNSKFELAIREEKRKNMQIQLELHNALKTQKNIIMKNQELVRLSEHDALTGLANRYSMNKYCESMFRNAMEQKEKFGVIIVDIDYFKEYNDTYGHIKGDYCIRAIAHVVEKCAKNLLAARYGGDEFLIMTKNMDDSELAQIEERIRKEVNLLHIPHTGSKILAQVSVTQGAINRIPEASDTINDFIHMADIALYKGKKTKRDTYNFYKD